MELPSKFEIHYYLNDASHCMDALVKNKCEAEFLAVVTEIARELGVSISLDSVALQEGGIREIWKAAGKNSAQIALVISTLALICSVIPKTDEELVELQKEDLRLSIEERKLKLTQLKESLEETPDLEGNAEKTSKLIERNVKIITRKSNYYRKLSSYDKVVEVGFVELLNNGEPYSEERKVPRDKFQRFIVHSSELEPTKVEAAEIEIVAPVLTKGKAKWKGLYEGSIIAFNMADADFKNSVLSRQVSFKNGSKILCELEIHRKVDEFGDVATSGYTVRLVYENIESGVRAETKQGKITKQNKKLAKGQNDLFSERDA